MRRATALLAAALAAAASFSSSAGAERIGWAIVEQDSVALRTAARESAQSSTLLWQGEIVEVRAERVDFLQVWDYRRERGGFVRAAQARRLDLKPEKAPELLSIVRFLRDRPGGEALGLGYVAAYVQAASPEVLAGEAGIEALDALGQFAERLASRSANGTALGKSAQAALAAHLEVAAGHGVRFVNVARQGRIEVCYDGDAYRRVLGMASTGEQRARAALALSRLDCGPDDASPMQRRSLDETRSAMLDRVDASALPAYVKNRVLMRRAAIWAGFAYQKARAGESPVLAAERAIGSLAGVKKDEMPEEDLAVYNEAAMRVNDVRWAAEEAKRVTPAGGLRLVTAPREAGETCVRLVDEKLAGLAPTSKVGGQASASNAGGGKTAFEKCSYGVVWANSATRNREGTAWAVAVQTGEAWLELWVIANENGEWVARVLPPATTSPEVGYAEFAGWVPGGTQMLVAREAKGEGRYRKNFEVIDIATLATVRQAGDATILGAFQRWRDAEWVRASLSQR